MFCWQENVATVHLGRNSVGEETDPDPEKVDQPSYREHVRNIWGVRPLQHNTTQNRGMETTKINTRVRVICAWTVGKFVEFGGLFMCFKKWFVIDSWTVKS